MTFFARKATLKTPSRRHRRLSKRIIERSDAMRTLSDKALRTAFLALRDDTVANAGPPFSDATLVTAFACVREAARRTTGMNHYDVQLLAGLALAQGRIAQMATGEGKTLSATLSASLHGLLTGNTHVMTVNAYLAERDYTLMRPVYRLLGLTCGLITQGQQPDDKRQAYACDITYGTGPEFGFDYLRDQMALAAHPVVPVGTDFRRRLRGLADTTPQPVQRGHGYALIDEADSVLIDEAGSALIMSGSSGQPNQWPDVYTHAATIAQQLIVDEHFILDEANRQCFVTEVGVDTIMALSGNITHLHLTRPWPSYVNQSLRAQRLFKRDVDYVVVDDAIQIVDEFTGRRFEDRHWNGGLHQAVEAKERVTITEESQSVMRISRQRYLTFYDEIAGMTGTVRGCEDELKAVFGVETCEIPRHKHNRHEVLTPKFFADQASKLAALADEVVACHKAGRPVLIGTRTVYDSDQIAEQLTARGLRPRVLNALQDQEESEIISAAGHQGAVTIATNMAGRGSDIPLGPGVEALGGLLVLVAEPNKSSRIDRQLTGRSARQGDPGASRLYACADDALIHLHDPELEAAMRTGKRLSASADADQLASDYSGAINALQARLEISSRESRQQMVDRDQWLQQVLEKAV